MNKEKKMLRNLIVTTLVSVLMGGFVLAYTYLVTPQADQAGRMTMPAPTAEPVTGSTDRQ